MELDSKHWEKWSPVPFIPAKCCWEQWSPVSFNPAISWEVEPSSIQQNARAHYIQQTIDIMELGSTVPNISLEWMELGSTVSSTFPWIKWNCTGSTFSQHFAGLMELGSTFPQHFAGLSGTGLHFSQHFNGTGHHFSQHFAGYNGPWLTVKFPAFGGMNETGLYYFQHYEWNWVPHFPAFSVLDWMELGSAVTSTLLDWIKLDSTLRSLLRKLIGETEFLQNNPPLLIPDEHKTGSELKLYFPYLCFPSSPLLSLFLFPFAFSPSPSPISPLPLSRAVKHVLDALKPGGEWWSD